jgi:chromosome segregation ATPase
LIWQIDLQFVDVIIFKLRMSREQRRVKSTKLSFENEKENTSGSDLESLLVSSIRYDNQNPMQIVESQGYEVRSKPSQGQQSQIKRQYFSNVYIEESSESRCQLCQRKIDAINENVSLISLKLQELESKLSLCFGKYGKAQTKLGELDLFIEQFKYFEKQNEERLKELSCSLATLEEENRFRFKESAGEQHRIKASISRLESKETEKLCLESKMVAHRLEKFKDEQELKLSEIV